MVLSVLPDRSTETEGQGGREGGKRVTEGVLYKKEGSSSKKNHTQRFWGWTDLEVVNVWVLRGMGNSVRV